MGLSALKLIAVLIFITASATVQASKPALLAGGALAGDRPRIIVSTDIGGSDPDDFQSLVHLFIYADLVDIEGLVASPPKQGRKRDILEVISAYEEDYPRLRRHFDRYPTPDRLRAVSKQGAIAPAPTQGWSTPTEGSLWIADRARAKDARPLWILVWGSITDVAQALHDDPSIADRIRIYSIGSWNTRHDRAARNYIFSNYTGLWWIENDTTFRGMYVGGPAHKNAWGNRGFIERHVAGHGALGELFLRKKPSLKMGDTPSFLYLLRGDPNDPTTPHWGGAFVQSIPRAHYWTDNPDLALSIRRRAGARTVNQWRRDILQDWQFRMDRLLD